MGLETIYSSIPVVATLITLVVASFYDLRTREIKEIIWIPALIVSAIFTYFVTKPSMLVFIFSIIPAALVFILMLLGLIGGADFLAMLLIGISTPLLNVLPIPLLTLLYSALIPSALVIYNLLINTVKYLNEYRKLECTNTSKWLLLLLGRPTKVRDFMRSKFMYPLTIFRCRPKKCEVICRSSFDINEDFKDHVNQVSAYLSSGYLSEDDYVWVTPALPHILFITIGYLLALITPGQLIYNAFNSVLSFLR